MVNTQPRSSKIHCGLSVGQHDKLTKEIENNDVYSNTSDKKFDDPIHAILVT